LSAWANAAILAESASFSASNSISFAFMADVASPSATASSMSIKTLFLLPRGPFDAQKLVVLPQYSVTPTRP
jgi:hypothetical protein